MHVTISDSSFNVQRSLWVGEVGAPRPMSITFLPNHLRPDTELCVFWGSEREPMQVSCTFAEFVAWLKDRETARIIAETPLSNEDMTALAQGKDIR